MKNGLIFDIQKYAIHDGPGIRTTVFLKGCPLDCWWCQNPEGQCVKPELIYRQNRCVGCLECTNVCSRNAISPQNCHVRIDRKKCLICQKCSRACPSDALEIAGKRMSLNEVTEEIDRDIAFYNESDGGVTFSGGEPLLQPDFLDAILTECKRRRFHTALETCGFGSYGALSKIEDKIDLFLYDVKIMDSRCHRKYTGSSNRLILNNLKKLAKNGGNIVINLPVIPSINDDENNIDRTCEFMRCLPSVQSVNLLPYHRGGVEKYKSLGKSYRLSDIPPPSDIEITSIRKRIESFGLKVRVGGG